MKRRIIRIDEEKCNGCGLCADACHEGAIEIIDNVARLTREHFCDGLGDCLPACPMDAISFEEREAPAYDEIAVKMEKLMKEGGCMGAASREVQGNTRLRNWPVQIKLAPLRAPYFDKADLLVAADCSAFACATFHETYMKGRVTLIGCPKLDMVDYSEKLAEILRQNDIRSIKVVRMEVPCCGGLTLAVRNAVNISGKNIPLEVVTIGNDGEER